MATYPVRIQSIQVSGDVPTLPSLRPDPNPNPSPTQTLGLREGRVSTSPETWIDPINPTKYCSETTSVCQYPTKQCPYVECGRPLETLVSLPIEHSGPTATSWDRIMWRKLYDFIWHHLLMCNHVHACFSPSSSISSMWLLRKYIMIEGLRASQPDVTIS